MAQISFKARLAFLLFNILYFMIGASMFSVGIYNIVSIVAFDNFARNNYLIGGVLFAIVGVAKILLSMVGFIGWGTGYKKLLAVYGAVALFVIFPTLGAGIFGLQQWYFVFGDVGTEYSRVFNSSNLYMSTTQLRNGFRDDFHCCGIIAGLNDYSNNGFTPETEDCDAALLYRANLALPPGIGCQYYVTDEIRQHLYYIGSIGLGYGFFELLSAIVAMQHLEGL